MKTFYVETLGCKVNQYESDQLATLLRAGGLKPAPAAEADLKVVNSCSVTSQAASQSRQTTRRLVRLGLPGKPSVQDNLQRAGSESAARGRQRVVVIGCWATSDTDAARNIDGVDAVLTHHDDLAAEFDRLLKLWLFDSASPPQAIATPVDTPPPLAVTQFQSKEEKSAAGNITAENKPKLTLKVNENPAESRGARGLPLLGEHQTSRQRAFVKIQDGCDAHCTYCIIPSLRPTLWSKPVKDVNDEVQRLVASGHVEIVLTGIFLGAYGQPTALHRRQASARSPLAELIELLSGINGLRRLRLSSVEPGDLTPPLLEALAGSPKVVPHFHIPLQSGSDLILRRMNRQYGRAQFLEMVEQIRDRFEQPALTTDIIVGFPGEDDAEFEQTIDIAQRAGFIHIHAFPYSPRPGTSAARWTEQFVHGSVVNDRVSRLTRLAADASFAYRTTLLGRTASVIVERGTIQHDGRSYRHGRSERYFPVLLDGAELAPGQEVEVQIVSTNGPHTFGTVLAGASA